MHTIRWGIRKVKIIKHVGYIMHWGVIRVSRQHSLNRQAVSLGGAHSGCNGSGGCRISANVTIVRGFRLGCHGPLTTRYAMTLVNLLDIKCSDQNIHQSAAHLLISVHILHPGLFRHIPVNYERSAHFYSDENTPIALELDTVPLLTPPFCPMILS